MAVVTICSVGTEIVLGDQVDHNAAWLSQRLRELGVEVRYHLAAGDDLGQLAAALRWLVDRSDVVIVGGGLGPTHDDLTREAVAELTGLPLDAQPYLEEYLVERFAGFGVRMPAQNLRQAQVPRGATVYEPVGTAPGFRLETARSDGGVCELHVLPGVPWEQRELYERDVQPALLERLGGGASVTRTVHVTGMGESSVAEAIGPVVDEHDGHEGVAVSFLATGEEIQVRVTAAAPDPAAARERTEPILDRIRALLGRAVAGVDQESIEETLGDLLARAGETVAFAESATAGGIAARMARVPGASRVMKGGVAVYAADAKVDVLGVPADLLGAHGPVSEEVTRDMAARVRGLFDADWGVAVTGVAGPGTQDGQPIGHVVWAVAGPDDEVTCRVARFPGDREAIQRRLGSAALEALRRRLLAR